MDGLLIDSERLYHEVEEEMLKSCGIEDLNSLSRFMGMKSEEVFAELKIEYNLSESVEELLERCISKMEERFITELQLMPYAAETISNYYKHYILALCSSSQKRLIDIALNKFRLKDFFKVIVSGDDVKNGKPQPEIFLKASDYLKISPAEILVLEDAPKGVEAAKRAGMFCFAVPNVFTQNFDFSLADAVLPNLGALGDFLSL